MKPFSLALVVLLFTLTPVGSGAGGDSTVTLELDLLDQAYKSCEVVVPAGADHGAVLDAAVASGCILSWSAADFGFGRYVDCIDNVCGQSAAIFVGTYWGYYVDGEYALTGIDDAQSQDGQTVRFNHESYSFLPL